MVGSRKNVLMFLYPILRAGVKNGVIKKIKICFCYEYKNLSFKVLVMP